ASAESRPMATGRRLFGTDGVRGEVGTFLTAELATALGRAAVSSAVPARRPQVLIVRDTRESGPMLESALAAGIAAAGGDALLAGVLPTPAASVLVKRLGLDLAAVVSASHNPFQDNGIKFFNSRGTKLDDEVEAGIEAKIEEAPAAEHAGRVRDLNAGLEDYLRELQATFPLDLSGRRVMLDCANGATYRAAPAIFERLGAEVEAVGIEPDGRNINAGCGSTHVESLAEQVAASGAEIGFAFDGDGDRVLAVDSGGRVHDGDELIALAARGMQARGELSGGVVVTVMSNYGFHKAMEEAGIEVAVTQVGDRYVIEEMLRRGWKLGGEQSGHIIACDFVSTGDGIAAALMTMRELGDARLEDAVTMEKLPQVLINVKVADREAIEGATGVWAAVEAEGEKLEGRGRVLLRPSGTEPLVRVMVEAPSAEEAEEVAGRLADFVRAELA
ncbi:MAG TPA: phosphoglucosamine mutase, partial [Solirubrobacterales bacterium]|nr:phosphoglucosamine mutase [Solirubrobacterales bacterium]